MGSDFQIILPTNQIKDDKIFFHFFKKMSEIGNPITYNNVPGIITAIEKNKITALVGGKLVTFNTKTVEKTKSATMEFIFDSDITSKLTKSLGSEVEIIIRCNQVQKGESSQRLMKIWFNGIVKDDAKFVIKGDIGLQVSHGIDLTNQKMIAEQIWIEWIRVLDENGRLQMSKSHEKYLEIVGHLEENAKFSQKEIECETGAMKVKAYKSPVSCK